MNLPATDIRSVGSTGAPYVTGNFAVYDAERHRSDVVILEARDFAGEPIATIRLPIRVPFTFHGGWARPITTPRRRSAGFTVLQRGKGQ